MERTLLEQEARCKNIQRNIELVAIETGTELPAPASLPPMPAKVAKAKGSLKQSSQTVATELDKAEDWRCCNQVCSMVHQGALQYIKDDQRGRPVCPQCRMRFEKVGQLAKETFGRPGDAQSRCTPKKMQNVNGPNTEFEKKGPLDQVQNAASAVLSIMTIDTLVFMTEGGSPQDQEQNVFTKGMRTLQKQTGKKNAAEVQGEESSKEPQC